MEQACGDDTVDCKGCLLYTSIVKTSTQIIYNTICKSPVSYTHLDVYKRQFTTYLKPGPIYKLY